MLLSLAECSTFVARDPKTLPDAKKDAEENLFDRLRGNFFFGQNLFRSNPTQ